MKKMQRFFVPPNDLVSGMPLPMRLWISGSETAEGCPAVPGYTFIGQYVELDGDCWCVYWCDDPPFGLLFQKCP